MNIFKVTLSKQAERNLLKAPKHISKKLLAWIEDVQHTGLNQVKKIPGYHDEPLKGSRLGQRSIRLSKAYQAIYIINIEGKIEIATVIEVNKHDY